MSETTTEHTTAISEAAFTSANRIAASFRYVGDVTSTKEGGIIVIATHLDKAANTVHVGLAFTKPGMRYDKRFMRAVATYRLRAHMATVDGVIDTGLLAVAEYDFGNELIALRPRVKKTSEVTRLSLDEYKAARELAKDASETNHANIGYRKTVSTYFDVSDFQGANSEVYAFSVEVSEDAGHMDIDQEIFENFILEGSSYPKWSRELVGAALEAIEMVRESEEAEITVAEHNETFGDLHVVNNLQHGWYLARYAYDPVIEALTPVCETRDELMTWLTRLPEILEDMPETESTNESTELIDAELMPEEDTDDENDDGFEDADFSDTEDEDTDTDEDETVEGRYEK